MSAITREHHCHALGCPNACPPRHLMCPSCWDKVPRSLQAQVYNAYNDRGPTIDGSWAPWWRLQAQAIAHVAFGEATTPQKERYLKREFAFADTLVKKTAARDAAKRRIIQ